MKELALLFIALAGSASGQTCYPPFELVGKECIYINTGSSLGWQEAREYCRGLGGDKSGADLAVFTSCDAFTVFAGYLGFNAPGQSTFWVGGHTEFADNNWRWVDGRALESGVPYWAYEEGHDQGQDCAAMTSDSHFQLADYPCDEPMYSVCSMPPVTQRGGGNVTRDDPDLPIILNCPDESVQVGDFCYWFSSSKKSWSSAEDYCRTRFISNRGELFSPDTCDEFAKMAHHLEVAERDRSHWTGAADVTGYQEWFWVNGDPVPAGPPFWATNMPQTHSNSGPHDYCALMSHSRRFYLEDDHCYSTNYYICKLHVVE